MPAKKKTAKKATASKAAGGGAPKLAEALILRADYQKKVEQLKARLLRNAKVQEGEKPAEDPAVLLSQIDQVTDDLEDVIRRINRTNSITELEPGFTITDAIAKRDILRVKHAILRDIAQAATVTQDRHTKSEVKFRGTVSVAQIQKQADDIARRHRELDARIQASNWDVELGN